MNNQVIETLNKAQAEYDKAQAEYKSYMTSFDWIFEQEDEELFNIYEDIAANKTTNLNMVKLATNKKQAEDAVLVMVKEFASEFATASQQEEINEALLIANKNVVARRKLLQVAMQIADVK